jgi:hypothetical protein
LQKPFEVETKLLKWMGFCNNYIFVIKYKKGHTNKLEDMLSRPTTLKIATFGTLMHMEPSPMMHKKRNTHNMGTLRRYFNIYRAMLVK